MFGACYSLSRYRAALIIAEEDRLDATFFSMDEPVLLRRAICAQPCSNATYKGTYYTLYALQQGTSSGYASWPDMDKAVADGNGSVSITGALATGNGITHSTLNYNYNVKPDCSATQTLTGAAQPYAAFELVDGGRKKLLSTSSSGTVLSGESYRAASHCVNASLAGTYGLLITYGSLAGNTPFTAVGPVNFDGSGALTFTETQNGTTYSGNGSYSVSADCSGSMTMTLNGAAHNLAIALVEGGRVLILDVDSRDQFSGFLDPVSNRSILPQFAYGGGWYTALYFTNIGNNAVSFQVSFIGDNGSPLNVPGVGSSATVNLGSQASSIIEAINVGDLNQGYVSVSLPPDVAAYGVFRQSVPGVPDQEAVVPLSGASSTQVNLAWDDTNFTTAVAIANPSQVAAAVSISVVDASGKAIGSSSLNLAANSKTETVLRNLPGLSGMAGNRGLATFSVTSGTVAVLGLRFVGAAFTSIATTAN
jgi:hypothetical protein